MKRFSSWLLCLALAIPAAGQNIDFQQLIAGKDYPFSLKLKDLNGDWRRMSIGSTDGSKGGMSDMLSQLMQMGAMSGMGKDKNDAASAMMGMSLLGGLFGGGGGSKEPVYYTRGQTVTVASETFLVAFRYQKPALDFTQLIMESQKNGSKEPDFSKLMADNKLTPDTPLTLSLVNIKTIGTLSNIRPFDMNQEIADSAAGGGGLMDLLAAPAVKERELQHPEKPIVEVRPDMGEGVAALTPMVKSALAADSQLRGTRNKITVVTSNSVMILKGHVASATLKARAAHVANQTIKNAGGGATVRNQLVVESK